MMKSFISKTLILLSILLFMSCDSGNPVSLDKDKKIKIGDFVSIGDYDVPVSGGSVKLTETGTELDGLSIEIPENSYENNRKYDISYSEIKKHDFGANFTPITPMIRISNGGGYSDSVIKVIIPAKIPAGHFAMGFFYDDKTGKLEPLPLIEYDENSITVATKHFSNPVTETASSYLKYGGKIQSEDNYANILVSTIDISKLVEKNVISSGFHPGTDDWEFINYGSYLAPGGHCAGQSMTAMWYYYEKKIKGNGNLFGKYDLLSENWSDNAKGFRFASIIQKDIDWGSWLFQSWMHQIDLNPSLDQMKWYAFAYSMLITGEPQFVGIWRENGKNPDGSKKYAGHALIAYELSFNEGKISIADPNHPGETKFITFNGTNFEPYSAKANADDDPKNYPFISYHAKTALINWKQIGNRWNEFQNGTIGTIPPNSFPEYTIKIAEKNTQLTNGFISDIDSLVLEVYCPSAKLSFENTGKIMYRVYNTDGTLLADCFYGPNALDTGKAWIKLKEGNNKLGFAIFGWLETSKYDNGDYIPKWIDFKWLDIQYKKPAPGQPYISSISQASGDVGDTISIYGNSFGNDGYVKIGTGYCNVIAWADKEIKCVIPQLSKGTYSLQVALRAGNDYKYSNIIEFIVKDNFLKKLHQCDLVSMTLYTGMTTEPTGRKDGLLISIGNTSTSSKVVWNGKSFTVTYSYELSEFVFSGTLTGTLSDDGLKVLNCSGSGETKGYYYDGDIRSHSTFAFSATDLTLEDPDAYKNYRFSVPSAQVQSHSSGISYMYTVYDAEGDPYVTTLKQLLWDYQDENSLHIDFAISY